MTKFTTAEAKYLLFQLEFWWEFLKISDDIKNVRRIVIPILVKM